MDIVNVCTAGLMLSSAALFAGNAVYDYSPCAGKAHSVRGGMKGALEILRNS